MEIGFIVLRNLLVNVCFFFKYLGYFEFLLMIIVFIKGRGIGKIVYVFLLSVRRYFNIFFVFV